VFLIRKAIAHIKKKRYTNDLAQLNNGDVECKFVCTLPCSVRDAKEHGIVIKRPGMLTAAKEGMKSVVGRDKRVFVAIECGAETILLILKPTGLVEMDGDPAEMDRSLIDTGFASSKGMKVVTLSSTEIRCIGDGNFTISPDSGHRTMRHVYTLTVDEPNNDSEAHSLQWLHAMYKLQLAMQADLQRMEGEQTLGAGGTDAALPAGWTETRPRSDDMIQHTHGKSLL